MSGEMNREEQVNKILAGLELPPGVIIRPWGEADFPATQTLVIAEGWRTLEQRPAAGLKAWQNSWPTLVAASNGEVIGILRAITDYEVTTYIAEILVDPQWRGRGIGKLLLEVCHRLVPETRFDLLSLERSVGFYSANGFREFRGFRKSDFTG